MLRRASLLCSLAGARTIPKPTECLFSIEDHVATITLNRPARKNALGRVLVSELTDCLAYANDAREVRAVVLASVVDGIFCAGADLKERSEMKPEEAREFVNLLRRTFSAVEDLRSPCIAAIDGAALGGGLELALAADLRIVGASAKLGLPETSLAIIPGAGGTQRLTKLIGLSYSKELIFSAKPISVQRAYEIGLVNRVVADNTTAAHGAVLWAKDIAKNGPIALAAAKESINRGWGLNRDDGMKVEQQMYEKVLGTKDRLEGLKAFGEKRAPVYNGE